MSYSYWIDEEIEILTENYPTIDDTNKLVELIPSKTLGKIKSKAKDLNLKRTYTKYSKISISEMHNDILECRICGTSKHYPDQFSTKIKINKTKFVIDICNKCHNDTSTINNYKRLYGIELELSKMHNTFSIVQWWKWTYNDKTPNGNTIRFIPRELQTEENIAILGRYVIEKVMKLNTKDEILSLSQKTMESFKISFSRTPFILGSPIKLIKLSFPELDFKNWEMKHSGNDFWKDYDNFLEAVHYYYYNIYQSKFKTSSINVVFSDVFIESEFMKLFRAKKCHYNHLNWREIVYDLDADIPFPLSPKEAFDGIKLGSIQEKEIYEIVKLSSIGHLFINIPHNSQDYKFHDSETGSNYIPDFMIMKDKPVIIEYFGCYDDVKDIELYEGYKLKTKNKVKYFNSLKDYDFIALYPKDLKHKFKGLKRKLNIE